MKLVLVYSIILMAIACAKDQRQVKVEILELGDPMSLVEGATLKKSFSNPSEFKEKFDGFELQAAHFFVERRQADSTDTDIYASQFMSPSKNVVNKKSLSPKFSAKINETHVQWSRSEAGVEMGEFKFDILDDNSLRATHFITSQESLPIEVLHQSIKNDESAFTILAKAHSLESGTIIMYFLYVKDGQVKKDFSKNDHIYLNENNQKIRWNNPKDIKINLCGKRIQKYGNRVLEGISDWNEVSKDLYKVMLSQKEMDYPPFSDLNTQCVYMIDDYKTKGKISNPATAYMAFNETSNTILDGDIMFFQEEIKKEYPDLEEDEGFYFYMNFISAHEMGHFLGLDHQFDEDVHSIMSYSDYTMGQYDKEAIQDLYSKETK